MSTATELATILSTTKFRLLQRHGTAATLDLNSMHAGEIAIATDTHAVYVCFGDGVFGQVGGGIVIKGLYADLATLEAAHATGTEGDFYFVGAASPYDVYGWFDDAWTDCGAWNDASLYATAAMVGDRTYTEDNYVTDDESATASIDALDMALGAFASRFAVKDITLASNQSDTSYTLPTGFLATNTTVLEIVATLSESQYTLVGGGYALNMTPGLYKLLGETFYGCAAKVILYRYA